MTEPTADAAAPTTSPVAPAETPAQIPVVTQTHATQISPATPAQEKMSGVRQTETERITQGQRKINLIWEVTQAVVAVLVVGATVAAAVVLILRGDSQSVERGLALLTAGFFLVIGTYFARTNHQKIGGVGPNDTGR